MLTLLSPAKKLLSIEKPWQSPASSPIFPEKTAELVALMRCKSPQQIAELMHLSPDLAELNYQRYQHFASAEKYPALLFFQGDVYKGLEAEKWNTATLEFSQSHLRILSGLYGLLKPLDLIQAYRLEMGTQLMNSVGKNLYDYWGSSISQALNLQLENTHNPILINLASAEYFKAVNKQALKFPVISIQFMEKTGDKLQIVGIYAKKARGALANFMMQNQLDDVESLKHFKGLNYHFCKKESENDTLVFIRTQGH